MLQSINFDGEKLNLTIDYDAMKGARRTGVQALKHHTLGQCATDHSRFELPGGHDDRIILKAIGWRANNTQRPVQLEYDPKKPHFLTPVTADNTKLPTVRLENPVVNSNTQTETTENREPGIFSVILNSISETLQLVFSYIGQLFSSFVDSVKKAYAQQELRRTFSQVTSAVSQSWSDFRSAVFGQFNKASEGVKEAADEASKNVEGQAQHVGTGLAAALNECKRRITEVTAPVVETLSSAKQSITRSIHEQTSGIRTAAAKLPQTVAGAIRANIGQTDTMQAINLNSLNETCANTGMTYYDVADLLQQAQGTSPATPLTYHAGGAEKVAKLDTLDAVAIPGNANGEHFDLTDRDKDLVKIGLIHKSIQKSMQDAEQESGQTLLFNAEDLYEPLTQRNRRNSENVTQYCQSRYPAAKQIEISPKKCRLQRLPNETGPSFKLTQTSQAEQITINGLASRLQSIYKFYQKGERGKFQRADENDPGSKPMHMTVTAVKRTQPLASSLLRSVKESITNCRAANIAEKGVKKSILGSVWNAFKSPTSGPGQ